MSEHQRTAAVTDAELVVGLRAGDRRAMAELYARHHAEAVRVGRVIHPGGDAEELVAEAFARVLTKIVDGGGPTRNFRAYLHSAIRNLNIERIRQTRREQPVSDRSWLLAPAVHHEDEPDVDVDVASRALGSLPENWQHLLWELEVQGRKPADVAAELRVSAANVSDTAYRAREGLRMAYLDQHLPEAVDRRCAWTRERLSRYTRGGSSPRVSAKIGDHLDHCAECAGWYDEIRHLNTKLGAAIWPVVLLGGIPFIGAAAAGAASTSTSEPPNRSSRPRSTGRSSRASRFSPSPVVAATAAAVVTALVAAAALAGPGLFKGASSTPRTGTSARPDPASSPSLPSVSDGRASKTGDDQESVPAISPVHDRLPEPAAASLSSSPPRPAPGPDPAGEPPAEPGVVDLEIGTPRVDPTASLDHWLLTVPVIAHETATAPSFTINLQVSLDQIAGFVEKQGDDWDCGPIQDGDSNGNPYFFDSVTCKYTYESGQDVALLQIVLQSVAPPTGSVAVSGDGHEDPDAADNTRAF